MELKKPLCFFFLLLTLLSSSQAYKFNVGGSQGWVPNPSESYNNWAGRNRFQINDTIVFKYNKGSDSVLEVTKEDYDKCNKTNPIKKFENGDSEFKFDRSGPFYFISGKDDNCVKGQKLIVVVLSPRTPPQPLPPSSPPKPSPLPPSLPPKPSPLPPSPKLSPSLPPNPSTSPSPLPPSPKLSPSPSPSAKPNPPTVLPPTSPANTLAPATSPPEVSAPTSPPAPETGSPLPSPIQPTSAPQSAPSNSTAPSSRNGGFSVAPSNILVYSVTFVVGTALLRY